MEKRLLARWFLVISIAFIILIVVAISSPFGQFVVSGLKVTFGGMNQMFEDFDDFDGDTAPNNNKGVPFLTMPTNIKVNGYELSFNAVNGATGYIIIVENGAPLEVNATTVDITDKLIGLKGYIKITVAAVNEYETGPSTCYIYAALH